MFLDLVASVAALGFQGGSVVKSLPANAGATGDVSSIPGWGISSGGVNGNPLQYLAWRIPWTGEPTVHKLAKSSTQLK